MENILNIKRSFSTDSFIHSILNNESCIFNDENLFEKIETKDEKVKFIGTPYLRYILFNYTKDFFKRAISILDINNDYLKVRYEEDVDSEYFKTIKNNYYNENIKAFQKIEKEKKSWMENHMDFYRMQPCLPSKSNYNFLFKKLENNFDLIVSKMTLTEAIQGYKASNEQLKTIENKDLDKYCSESKPMLNYEHRDEYNTAIKEIYKKYNIMTDDELRESCSKTNVKKTRLSLDRSKCKDFSYLNNILSFINIP